MDRGRAVVAMLVVVGSLVVGVQLADPFTPSPEPATIDPTDPPHRIAYDALMQAETRDHTMRMTVDDVDDPGVEYRALRRVENSGRESLTTQWPAEQPYVLYTNEHVRWVGEPGDLAPDFHDVEDWGEFSSGYYQKEVLLDHPSAVAVTRRNETTLVLSIRNEEAAPVLDQLWSNVDESATTDPDRPNATASLYVDLESRRLDRFELTVLEADGGERGPVDTVVVREYSGWDRTEVDRPPSAGYTLREFLYDLADYRP